MTKAILFDLDDTLYARQDPFCRAFRTAFGPGGELFPVLPASLAAEAKAGTGLWAESDDGPLSAVYRSFLRHGYDVFEDGMTGRITMEQMYIARIKRTTEELGFTLTDEQGLAFQAQYVYALEHLQTGPVIAAMLDYCVEKGCFLGLITNGKSGHQRMKYHAMELSRWIPEDHVLASGRDINVLVLDTEVYSNTGGQASKSTAAGAIAKFAAGGKETKKKDLGMMAMSYGYVYVAQVAMGSDPAQTLKAIREAEAYDGPSLIICYCPCIEHHMKAAMGMSQTEEKNAVDAGYWHLYRYNPDLKKEGKNPFQMDSKEPKGDLRAFLMGENRYASLELAFPDKAERLYQKAETDLRERYESYLRLAGK